MDDRELTEYIQARCDAAGDGFEVEVKIEDDDSPDLSYYGEYVGESKLKHDEAFFDRALDRVFLDQHEQYRFLHPVVVDERCLLYREQNGLAPDADDHIDVEADGHGLTGECECGNDGENKEAIEQVERFRYRRETRYITSCNYGRPGKEKDALTDDERRKYIEQDAARLEAYNNGDWRCVGIVVEVSKDGVKLAAESVWGVESDSDDGHFKSEAESLYDEASEQAKKKLAELREDAESVSVHRDVMAAVLDAIRYAEAMYGFVSEDHKPLWLKTLLEARAGIVKKLDEVA